MKPKKGARNPLAENQFMAADAVQFYDEHARRFMGTIYRRFAKKAAGIHPGAKRILDIGAGSGLLTIALAKAFPGAQITGIDISEEMLKMARQNAAAAGFADRVNFLQAPAENLPFKDGYFNLTASNASLHLWKDPPKVIDEIARVTAPGGHFILWDNYRINPLKPFLRLLGRVMGMNTRQCRLWMAAVGSSYTAGEAKTIVSTGAIKGARVKVNPALMELCIEWQKALVD